MRRFFGLVLVSVGIVLAPSAHAQQYLATDEVHVRDLINQHRVARGLGALTANGHLTDVARAQSVRMEVRGDIYHNPNLAQEVTALGLPWTRIGENVGVGANVIVIEDAFLASPPHHENIVSPYNVVGVGVVAGSGGRVYVTQVFGRLEGPLPVSQAPRPGPASAPPVTASPPTAPPATLHPASPTPEPRLPPLPTPVVIQGGVTALAPIGAGQKPELASGRQDEAHLWSSLVGFFEHLASIAGF